MRLGNYEEAYHGFRHAIVSRPDEANSYYNMACFKSQIKETEEALSHLERALELDAGRILTRAAKDEDFDRMRNHPKFIALLEAYKNKAG